MCKHAVHFGASNVRNIYMRFVRLFLIIIAIVLSMTCHAQTVSLGQLTNTKWKLVSPVSAKTDIRKRKEVKQESLHEKLA